LQQSLPDKTSIFKQKTSIIKENKKMKNTILNVEGMSCSHCVNAVEKAVGALEGVTEVRVDLDAKKVTVDHDENVTLESIKNAIEDQGYDVV
jgi:copper chaperone